MKFAPIQFSKRFPALTCCVFVQHEKVDAFREFNPRAKPSGRATAAAIVLPEGAAYIGVTICADGDQFVKKVGRAKALGRAFQAYRNVWKYRAVFSLEQLKAAIADEIEIKRTEMVRQTIKREAARA